MAEGKTSDSPIWSPRDIANNANNWTLASDASLLRYLEDFSEKLLAQASETNDKLDNLLTSLDETSLSLDLARNDFSSLSNTQFIESRIYEDDETVENQQNAHENEIETTKMDGISKDDLKKAALKGLEVIDKYFDKVEVPHSDSEDETDFPSYVLRPKDLYMHRPLPYVIGTEEWYKSPNAGLADSSSDSEDDKVSEKFSDDSESEVELAKPKTKTVPLEDSESSEDGFENSLQPPVANSTFNDTRNNLDNTSEYSSVSVQAPSSQQVFAEQLAKKLGKVLEENEPEINKKPIQKPQSNYGKLFSEEPPPIEDNDDDMFASTEKKHGIFSGGDGLFDDLEDDVSFWGVKTGPKKSEPASSEREKVVPNLFDDDSDDLFVKPKPTVSTNNSFKAELDKKLKTPKNLFDASSSSDDDLFAKKTEEKHSNSQRILTSTEKAPPIVSKKPSGFDGDSPSNDMFSTNNKKAKTPENIEEKSLKSKNSDQRKAPVGGVKIMADPNFLQDKEFNKLLKTRKQYSSDTSFEDKEEIAETNGTKEETKPDVLVQRKQEIKKPEVKAKIEEEIKPKKEETSKMFEEKDIKSANVTKSLSDSKKISLFDDDDDDLFKDNLFSAPSGTKKSSNLFTEDSKTKNLFDDTPNSIFDDDILIIANKDNQAKKIEETSKKNVLEEDAKKTSNKPKIQKKALSLFDEDEDSDDFFSSNVVKKPQDVKIKEDTSKNTGYKEEKMKKISLFDDEEDDIFSSNVFAKKESKKTQNKLFFDEPEKENLLEHAKESGLFSDSDLFLDKSLDKKEEIVEKSEEIPNSILKNGDDQGKIEKRNERLQKGESVLEDLQPKNEEIDDFIFRNVNEERIIDDEIQEIIEEKELKIEEEIKVDKEGIKISEEGNKTKEELNEHREEIEERKIEEINTSEEINDIKSNNSHNSLESSILKEDLKLEEEITREIKENTPKKKVITRRIIQESEYNFEPQAERKPELKSEENIQIPEQNHPNSKEETPEHIFEEIPEFLNDIPPVKNIFEDNSPQNDIFAGLTENEENISKNGEDTKSGDRRLLFDSSPPPDIDTWEPDNFEDDIYSFDNTESILGGQRSSIFDREPPSLFINQSSGIVIEQETRLETDNVSSFYPYACSSRRFSADTFGEEYSDDSLFKKNSHTISNVPSSSKKIEEVSSFLDITPSGKYSELYSEITEKDVKPRKSVTFDDDVKKFGGEDSSLKIEEILEEKVGEIETKLEGSVKEKGDIEEIDESTKQLVFKKQDEEMKNDVLKISKEKENKPAPNILPKPTVSPRKENLTDQDRDKIHESPPRETKEKSSPGKLKHNLNINVQALLPGMVPRRPNNGRPPRPTTIAAPSEISDRPMENINSQIPFHLPRIDLVKQSNIPDTQNADKVDPEVLQSVTKTRARIPNRRPSTRRGREAFRKSCVDFVVMHDEEDTEAQEENQPPEKSASLPSSPNHDFLADLTANLEIRRPSTPNSPPPPLPSISPPPSPSIPPPPLPSIPPPSMATPPLEISKEFEEPTPEKLSFVKTDDFASPEFFNKPDLFSENENDDDLFSEKKLPPKSTMLTTSLFGDDDDDDFLQSVSSQRRNDAKLKPELSSSSSASARRPKSVVLKKLENIEVTDDPLSAFDQ